VSRQFHYTKRNVFMPFLLAEILNFQGSAHLRGVGSFSHIIYDVKITEELHPTRDTLFENIDMMKLRITLINQINKDVTTHI
ncbi:hypothetical protein ACTNA4_15465, partial [Bariatricus sp. HCP28S3_A7]